MSGMVLSTDCWQGIYHGLCDGWYGRNTAPCECDCHLLSVREVDEEGFIVPISMDAGRES